MSSLFKRFVAWLDDEQAPVYIARETIPKDPLAGDVQEDMEIGEPRKVLVLETAWCDCRGNKECDEHVDFKRSHEVMRRADADGVQTAHSALVKSNGKCHCEVFYAAEACKLKPECVADLSDLMLKRQKKQVRLETSTEARDRYYSGLQPELLYQLEVRKTILPPLRALTKEMCDDAQALTHIYELIKTKHGQRGAKQFDAYRKSVAWLTKHIQNWFAPGSAAAQAAAAHYNETHAEHFASDEQPPQAAAVEKAPKKKRRVKE